MAMNESVLDEIIDRILHSSSSSYGEYYVFDAKRRRDLLKLVQAFPCFPKRLVNDKYFTSNFTNVRDGEWTSLYDIVEDIPSKGMLWKENSVSAVDTMPGYELTDNEKKCIKIAIIEGLKKMGMWNDLLSPEELAEYNEYQGRLERDRVKAVVSAKTGRTIAGKRTRRTRRIRKTRKNKTK